MGTNRPKIVQNMKKPFSLELKLKSHHKIVISFEKNVLELSGLCNDKQ